MSLSKPALAASAAVSVLASAGVAQAAITGSSPASLSSQVYLSTPLIESGGGTGSGTLNASGSFVLNVTQVGTLGGGVVVPSETLTISTVDTFTGTTSGTTFTASGGTTQIVSCTGGADCSLPNTFSFTSISGTVSLVAGGTGTLVGLSKQSGTKAIDTWTITNFTPNSTGTVPLPPAVWLLGSGLLGLVGTARRRLKRGAQ